MDKLALLEELGQKIRVLRDECGFTQEQVANLADFSRSYYNEIENGKRNISFNNLFKLLKVLDIDLLAIIKKSK